MAAVARRNTGTPLRTLVEVTCDSPLFPYAEPRKEARSLDCV